MATPAVEDHLLDLLVKWDELRRQGHLVTAEELCSDRPELVSELCCRIEALRGIDPVIEIEDTVVFPTPGNSAAERAADRELPECMHALATYRPQRYHARGGLGEVLAAHQEELGRLVALKRIQPERLHEGARKRFLREAAITAGLQHPGIVPIYGLGHDDQGPFYTMPLVDGQTLQEAIHDFHRDVTFKRGSGPGTLRFRALLQKFTAVCDTVAYAHDQGVIHRDLKPSNIMLGRYGETLVMDWGLAKHFGTADSDSEREMAAPSPSSSPDSLTATGAVLGTPQYMSPEQAKGLPTGPASDVFNLGLILYTILTGTPAFQQAGLAGGGPFKAVRDAAVLPPRQRDPHLPLALDAICLKALSAQPEDRYASARDLGRDLEKWMADEPVTAYRRTWLERMAGWARRHRAWVHAGTAALILVTVVSITASLGMYSERQRATEAAQAEAAARTQAVKAETEAVTALHQAQRSTAMLTLDTGLRLCEQGKVSHGILYLARCLRELPVGEQELQRVVLSNLTVWGREAHRLRFSVQHARGVDIERIVFSRDGKSFMTAGRAEAGRRGEIRVWDASSGKPIGPVLARPIGTWAMAMGADGKTVVSGSGDFSSFPREVKLWNVTPEHSSCRVFPHPAPVLAAALSPDGKTVLTGCEDGNARVWDSASGSLQGTVLSHPEAVKAIAFNSEGTIVLTGSTDGTARLWALSTGEPIGKPMNHHSEVIAVAFSPNGKLLLTATRDGAARIWNAGTMDATGVVLRHPYSIRDNNSSLGPDSATRAQTSVIKAIAFSPDGKAVLTGSVDATARLWDVFSGKLIGEPFLHEGDVNAVAFSPDGEAILTSTRWKTHLWDAPAIGQTRLRLQLPHWVGAVAFSPDGKTILTGSADPNPLNLFGPKGQARLWDASSGAALCDPLPHRLWIVSAAFSPDGTRFLTGGGHIFFGPGEARLWRTTTQKPIGNALTYDGAIYTVAFNPDGQTFLTAGKDNIARLYEIESAKLIRTFPHRNSVLSSAFSPDGTILLTGDDRGIARRWNVATGESIGEPISVFSPAGDASIGGEARTTTGPRIDATGSRPDVSSGRVVMGVAFSPDGRTFLTGGGSPSFGEARLWDTQTGKPTGRIFHHELMIRPVAFSPDGRTVLTGGGDFTVRLWDVDTGRPVGAALHHDHWVAAAAFSPDGSFILTGSRDKTVRLWPTPGFLTGQVERISLWVEVMTGMELDDAGSVRVLDGEAWRKRQVRLQALGGPPGS
jgi:WD40 repeat protein/tRNA A-37 threonylcarbamoyl transferase component Bud32